MTGTYLARLFWLWVFELIADVRTPFACRGREPENATMLQVKYFSPLPQALADSPISGRWTRMNWGISNEHVRHYGPACRVNRSRLFAERSEYGKWGGQRQDPESISICSTVTFWVTRNLPTRAIEVKPSCHRFGCNIFFEKGRSRPGEKIHKPISSGKATLEDRDASRVSCAVTSTSESSTSLSESEEISITSTVTAVSFESCGACSLSITLRAANFLALKAHSKAVMYTANGRPHDHQLEPSSWPRVTASWYQASHQPDIGRRSKWVHAGPSFPGDQLGSRPGCKL
ncbi:hypothetical protein C8R45DRAFT_947408 [Mycena sanguinolenta]|nr:hypothetical protein C8R45DRAFT_947408 [Mycena sanguinolenta]